MLEDDDMKEDELEDEDTEDDFDDAPEGTAL